MMNRALSTYQNLDVQAMSPARRIVALYTHLLVCLRQAKKHLANGEIEARSKRLTKSLDVIEELLVSLDRTVAPEFTDRLAALYAYWSQRILHVDVKQDRAALDEVITMVESLHGAWSQAALQVEQPQTVGMSA